MNYLPTSCLVLFFFFSLFHPLPCSSRKEEHEGCEALFQCGDITAGFPFWGGDRPQACGHPLLKLHCYDNSASLFISDQEYYIFHLNQTSITLRFVKKNLLDSICTSSFTNKTLLPETFELSQDYKSLTVFYPCFPSRHADSRYACPGLGPIAESESPEYTEICHDSFTANIPKSSVPEEKQLNLTHWESALGEAFKVKVKINVKLCQECPSSYGFCGFNISSPLEVICRQLHPPTDAGLSTGAKAGIGIASGFLVVILIPAVLFFLIRRRKKTQEAQCTSKDLPTTKCFPGIFCVIRCQRKTSDDLRQRNLMALIPLKHYSYAQVKRITNSFAEVVGKGGFGTVYRGTLSDSRSVAVKILKDSKGNGEDFINEVASISKTSHVNIVSLLGFCSEGSKRAIIYEYLENGSLDQFISRNTSMRMDWMALYKIALGVARGLEYLHHGCRTRIVHFDIKPQNVLLDDNLCPKVSDFGLAKLCEKKESILSLLDARGTIGYIAPEVFSRMYGRVFHKSDVYSYGMLLLEMIGARNKERADQNSASNTSSMYFPEWIYKDLEEGDGERLIENGINIEEEEQAKKMALVGLWCIQSSPPNRPPMNSVVEMLEGSVDALEVPPRPVLQQIPRVTLQESSTLSEDISVYTEECSRNVA